MDAPAAPEVTFVTPAYRAEATLAATLERILGQATRRSFEVVVVDDGSPDGSLQVAQAVAERDPRVRVLTQRNGGEASALNTGWRAARGRFVAIVEADVEPAPDWLERCLGVLEREPDAWAVGGYLETPPDDPWIARLAGYEIEAKLATKPREARHLTSANVVYRAQAFAAAGPFDERLVNASLDSVFNARLVKAGKRLVYEPAARVKHHYKTTAWGYLTRQYAYARYRVHNEVLDLYPADRLLAWRVAVAAAAVAAGVLAPLARAAAPQVPAWTLAAGPGLLALALLLELPRAAAILLSRRDPVGLVHPPVVVLRNVVGAVGYAVGVLMKALGRV